jgi:riboflavin kinase/FMN adenylyltransferase
VPCVVAVGAFDGVHLGHQRVLSRLRARATACGGEAVVALDRAAGPAALSSLRQRLGLLDALGVDRVVLLRGAAPRDPGTVAAQLGARVLVCSDATPAPAACEVDRVEPVIVDGARLSAARLSAALTAGDLAAAVSGLGRPHAVEGRIVHGFHRGAPLGIPTANLRLRDLTLPPDGVYAVRARLRGAELCGIANVGFNPTFGNRTRSVETHLFDFAGDVYGQRLLIAFVARVRGEQRFASVEALLAQIRTDIAAVRALFARQAHGG